MDSGTKDNSVDHITIVDHLKVELIEKFQDSMNRNFASSMQLVILLGMMLLVALGCAHTICFKAVDATTKEPLVGVATTWRQDRHDMIFGSDSYGPTNLPPSGKEGVIKIGGLHRSWQSRFTFSCAGYSNVYGLYSAGNGLSLGERISYFDDAFFKGQFMLEGKLTGGILSNGCFLIPMSK
jgi:hypothetical protein